MLMEYILMEYILTADRQLMGMGISSFRAKYILGERIHSCGGNLYRHTKRMAIQIEVLVPDLNTDSMDF